MFEIAADWKPLNERTLNSEGLITFGFLPSNGSLSKWLKSGGNRMVPRITWVSENFGPISKSRKRS